MVWVVRQVGEKLCKVTFASEVDFKISSAVQKQVAPKIGHLASYLRNYVEKVNEERQ